MDAVCGPSNALQNFQKHAQQDRTLQQDRLNLRQDASQVYLSNELPVRPWTDFHRDSDQLRVKMPD